MGAARGCSHCSRETVTGGSSQWVPALSATDGRWEPLDCQRSKFRSDPSCGCFHAPVASGGELSGTQLHSLSGQCVVTAGLSEYTVPIVGEGMSLMWDYDLATVDYRQLCSTCHCLQLSTHFESGVSGVCMRAGSVGWEGSCRVERVSTRDAGGVGTRGAINT